MTDTGRRAGLWRRARSRLGRRIAAGLDALGITVSRVTWYEAPTRPAPVRSPPAGVSISVLEGPVPADVATAVEPDDLVLGATAGGDVVGYVVLSDRPVRVAELGSAVDPDGRYVWGLYVEPAHRNRGIATALLAAARTAAARDGADSVTALVASSNAPSRRAFEAAGFAPIAEERYVRGFGVEHRRRTPAG